MTENRNRDERNRKRVQNYRMKIRLLEKPSISNPCSPESNMSPDGYKHRSSETRAYQHVLKKLPSTPAKKATIIEKLLILSTPRSRKNQSSSPSIKSMFSEASSRRNLSEEYNVLKSFKNGFSELQSRKAKRSALSIVAHQLLQKSIGVSAVERVFGVHRHSVS